MRRVAQFLIRLYPANWRERYGEEFEALLDDSSPSWPAILDLSKGAVKMQFSAPTFPKLALMLSIAGLLTGLAISYTLTPTYISRAELQTEGIGVDSLRPVDYLMQCEREVLSRTSLSNIIQDFRLDLYREERAGMPLEDVIKKMGNRDIEIRIDTPADAGQDRVAFNIAFAYRDRVQAQHTVEALIARFQEFNTHGYVSFEFHVLDPPSLPILPAEPNRPMIMAAGLGAGLVAASVMAIFPRRRPSAVRLRAQTA